MTFSPDLRELLTANVAIELGLVQPAQAAEALRAFCEADDRSRFSMADALERIAGLSGDGRKRLLAEVSRRLVADETVAPLRDVTPERYVDFQAVGEGGMGIVYLALDTELNRQVAFKVVRPQAGASGDDDSATTPMRLTPPGTDSPEAETFENLKKRFLQEAWITGGMEHPGVTPVYELGATKSGIPYYTMRYIRGKRTLADAFETAGSLDERLALLEPFLKICDTTRYAHARGVIHRDLKPRNIALGEFGEAVVLDWGLSKVHGKADVSEGAWHARVQEYRTTADLKTVVGAFGTPGYMAPETLGGQSADVDEQSDVYSLGAMFYECLTGRLPFDFDSFAEYANKCLKEDPPPAHERDPAVPEELSDVCARALARDKAKRYGSVDEFAEALRRWRDEGALERELAALFKKAVSASELADELTGAARVRQADRASIMLTKLLAQRPEHREALALQAKTKEQHERGVGEQESASRRRIGIRLGLFAIPILVVGVQILLVYVERREKERERDRARAADSQTQRERIDGLRSDLRRADGELAELRSRKSEALARLSTRCFGEHRVGAARVAAARARLFGGSGLRELATAEQSTAWLQTIVATQVAPSAIALSHDAAHLFWTAPGERTVRVLDIQTGKTIRRLDDEHADAVTRLFTTSDGRLLSGSENGVINVWDPAEGKLIRSYGADAPVTALLESPDQKFVVAGTAASTVVVHRTHGDQRMHRFELDAGDWVTTLALYTDGDTLGVGMANGVVHLLGLDEAETIQTNEKHTAAISLLASSADGNHVYTCSVEDQRLLIWDAEDESHLEIDIRLPTTATAVAAAPAADRLFVGYADGRIRVWELSSGTLLHLLDGHRRAVDRIVGNADGSRFFSIGSDKTVRAWRRDDVADLRRPDPLTAIHLSADGGTLFLARADHTIEIWDVEGAKKTRTIRTPCVITALAASPAGTRLYGGGLDRHVYVWNVGWERTSLARYPNAVCALALSPKRERLYVATINLEIHIFDLATRTEIGRLTRLLISALVVSPDEKRLAGGSPYGDVRIWNADELDPSEPQKRLFDFHHKSGVTVLAFSPTGNQIAAGGADGTVRRWDLLTMKSTRPPREHAEAVSAIAYTDGRIVSKSVLNAVLDWNLASGETALRAGGFRLLSPDATEVSFPENSGPVVDQDLPWILRPAKQRLIDLELRTGLFIDVIEVKPVRWADLWPATLAPAARTDPWSR